MTSSRVSNPTDLDQEKFQILLDQINLLSAKMDSFCARRERMFSMIDTQLTLLESKMPGSQSAVASSYHSPVIQRNTIPNPMVSSCHPVTDPSLPVAPSSSPSTTSKGNIINTQVRTTNPPNNPSIVKPNQASTSTPHISSGPTHGFVDYPTLTLSNSTSTTVTCITKDLSSIGPNNNNDSRPSSTPFISHPSDLDPVKRINQQTQFFQTKSTVHSFDSRNHSVCTILFRPKPPIITSASEDGTICLWSSTTYQAESTLTYPMERTWDLAATNGSNMLACGFDGGCVVIEPGSNDPVASMDNTCKIVWAKNNEIQTANERGLASGSGDDDRLPDGERIPVIPHDLGACESYPRMLKHNCNGRRNVLEVVIHIFHECFVVLIQKSFLRDALLFCMYSQGYI